MRPASRLPSRSARRAPDGVAVRVCEEEPTRLIDAFGDADVAFLVDAVSTGAPAGTVHRFDASEAPVPSRELRSSTHALGIGEALELARALGRLPRRTVVFGVEGSDFVAREGMTPAVAEGVARAVGEAAGGGDRVHEQAVMRDLARPHPRGRGRRSARPP